MRLVNGEKMRSAEEKKTRSANAEGMTDAQILTDID